MCESDDGFNTAAMRQCAGSGAPARGPAGMYSEAVIAVLGIDSDFKASQGPCWTAAAINNIIMLVIMVPGS